MPKSQKVSETKAPSGEKMIEVKIRFWTNDIATQEGRIVAKHAWSSGVVRVERNPSHGIVPGAPKPFHSLLDIGAVIEKTLIEHGIVLHPSDRLVQYFAHRDM